MLPMRWTDRVRSFQQLRWPLAAPYEVLEERDVNIERVWFDGDDTRWLMGYPREWDDCAPTEMPSSRSSRRRSSEP